MTPTLIGHTDQRTALAKLFLSGSLPSALLFSGPSGIGKSLLAKELSSLIFCEAKDRTSKKIFGGCGECKSCLVFQAGNMPDFFLLDCGEKDDSAISRIRELLYSMHLRSFSSPYRVVILDQVERLSLQACNVLLKSIEEPRPNSFFILISSNPSRLPITVRSRCQDWSFNPLSELEMREVIQTKPELLGGELLSDWAITELITLSDGAPANLAQLSTALDLWEELRQGLDKCFQGDLSVGLEFAARIGKNKEMLPQFLQLARMHARQHMQSSTEDLHTLKWSFALSNFITAEYLIFERNLNATYVLNTIFADLFSDSAIDANYALAHNEHLIEKIVV